MEKELHSSTSQKSKSKKWVWLVIAIIALGLALVCCLAVIGGVMLFRSGGGDQGSVPGLPSTATVTISPALPSVPTASAGTTISQILDAEADPIWGLTDLQRGFSPDPHLVSLGAEGVIDTSATDLPCGFSTNAPSFTFTLSGGAEAGFLRLYFAPDDQVDATLIVHTPDQKWLCGKKSSAGSGAAPVVDIEYAASGKYAVWVGIQQAGASVLGSLNITASAANTP